MSILTLTLDDDLLAQAEAYAQRTGTDLSGLVAELLRPVVAAPVRQRRPLSADVEALSGCISLPPDFDLREFMAQAVNERHGV